MVCYKIYMNNLHLKVIGYKLIYKQSCFEGFLAVNNISKYIIYLFIINIAGLGDLTNGTNKF
jgi:hypothetical protein